MGMGGVNRKERRDRKGGWGGAYRLAPLGMNTNGHELTRMKKGLPADSAGMKRGLPAGFAGEGRRFGAGWAAGAGALGDDRPRSPSTHPAPSLVGLGAMVRGMPEEGVRLWVGCWRRRSREDQP